MIRWIPIALFMLLLGCKPPVQELPELEPDPVREEFVKVNRYIQRRQQDHIAAFVERVGWEAQTTPSGLWIVVEEEGQGPKIRRGQQVSFAFRSRLLDGSPCYQATASAPKLVRVGQGGIESGVEEALTYLRPGSKATLLIPPHLGHGNFGERDKIPGNSVLLYNLEILGDRQLP